MRARTVGIVVLVLVALGATARAFLLRATRITARSRAEDHLSQLLRHFITEGSGVSKPWPAFSGKRFVLGLVARNRIDRRDPRALSVFFSPADASRSLEQ